MVIGGLPDIPALLICIAATLAGAQGAARIANDASPKVLNRITGAVLFVLGVVMLVVNLLTK